MGSPLVSVVMPTYMRLDYFPQALGSVLRQTFTDFEVVVSDNAVSEELRSLLASYGDDRIRYRHNGRNVGATKNALEAYRDSRGQYLATLQDDDVWDPRLLEKLVAPLEEDPTLVISFCDQYIITSTGAVDDEATRRNTRNWRRDILQAGPHVPCQRIALIDRSIAAVNAAVFRKSAIDWDDFPTDIGHLYDLWMSYLACRGGGGAYYCKERLACYRHHEEQITAATRFEPALVYCYERFLMDKRLRPLRRELKKESAKFRVRYGLLLLEQGDTREARRQLLRGMVFPPKPRAVVGLALSLVKGGGGPVGRARQLARRRWRLYDR